MALGSTEGRTRKRILSEIQNHESQENDNVSNVETPLQRVTSEDDPNRCQAVGSNGQCSFIRVPGSDYCTIHGGAGTQKKNQRDGLNNYRIQQFQARLMELGNSDGIKSLRDEIAILRMLVEERMKTCNTGNDLILHSGPISDLITRIEKCVSSCHKLEGSMGQLVDKQAILHFATKIVDIVADEVGHLPNGDVIVASLADKIIKEIKADSPAREA